MIHAIPVTHAQKVDFNAMAPDARDEFLSMDLIERMIWVEQRVSVHFRKFVKYNETEYYKSLPHNLKVKFENYLKWKKRKKFVYLFLILSIMGVLFFTLALLEMWLRWLEMALKAFGLAML